MLGEQGCPTVVGGELQKNVCASRSTASGSGSGEEQQLLTVLASDAPLYLIREEPESHPRIKLDDHYTTASSWVPPQSGFNHLGLVTPFLTLTDFERRLDAEPNWWNAGGTEARPSSLMGPDWLQNRKMIRTHNDEVGEHLARGLWVNRGLKLQDPKQIIEEIRKGTYQPKLDWKNLKPKLDKTIQEIRKMKGYEGWKPRTLSQIIEEGRAAGFRTYVERRDDAIKDLTGACASRAFGWWAYTVCHFDQVTQWHPSASEQLLAVHQPPAGTDYILLGKEHVVDKSGGLMSPDFRVHFEQGAPCDGSDDGSGTTSTNAKTRRRTVVTYKCVAGWSSEVATRGDIVRAAAAYIYKVVEPNPCEYEIVMHVPALCNTDWPLSPLK